MSSERGAAPARKRRSATRAAPRTGAGPGRGAAPGKGAVPGKGTPPGKSPAPAVRGSTTGRPIMTLLDLLGRRWALRILWELRAGALGFNELQAGCDRMSPSVLNQRLAELRAAELVVFADDRRYQLSGTGHDLLGALAPLDAFAKRWSAKRGATAATSGAGR